MIAENAKGCATPLMLPRLLLTMLILLTGEDFLRTSSLDTPISKPLKIPIGGSVDASCPRSPPGLLASCCHHLLSTVPASLNSNLVRAPSSGLRIRRRLYGTCAPTSRPGRRGGTVRRSARRCRARPLVFHSGAAGTPCPVTRTLESAERKHRTLEGHPTPNMRNLQRPMGTLLDPECPPEGGVTPSGHGCVVLLSYTCVFNNTCCCGERQGSTHAQQQVFESETGSDVLRAVIGWLVSLPVLVLWHAGDVSASTRGRPDGSAVALSRSRSASCTRRRRR